MLRALLPIDAANRGEGGVPRVSSGDINSLLLTGRVPCLEVDVMVVGIGMAQVNKDDLFLERAAVALAGKGDLLRVIFRVPIICLYCSAGMCQKSP